MIEPVIEIDKAKLRAFELALRGHELSLGRIVVRSLKKTAAKGRTLIDREVRRIVVAKKKAVMARIVYLARPSASHWRARLGISAERLHVASFGSVTQTKKGVRYTIQRGQRRTIPGGFIRTMRRKDQTEYKVVFRRALKGEKPFAKGRPTRRGILPGQIVSRKPLIAPKGPSIGEVVRTDAEIVRKVEADGAATLAKEMHNQINWELSKRIPK